MHVYFKAQIQASIFFSKKKKFAFSFPSPVVYLECLAQFSQSRHHIYTLFIYILFSGTAQKMKGLD